MKKGESIFLFKIAEEAVSILMDYYDPMYDYQLDKKLQRVVFRGDKQEFLNWSASVGAAAKDPSA